MNSHLDTKMPTSAISAATTAVAAPPDHRVLLSTRRWISGSGSPVPIGIVMARLTLNSASVQRDLTVCGRAKHSRPRSNGRSYG